MGRLRHGWRYRDEGYATAEWSSYYRAPPKRRRLRDDRLVEHQDDRADTAFQPAFPPPFDCRQVSGRRASWWRGRFQRMRSRARARPTVVSETSTPWWSRRWRTSRGAVQTVWR